MQTINDIVELIFSNPPKQPMSFEISFDFSNGSNLFHFLMTILINGAKLSELVLTYMNKHALTLKEIVESQDAWAKENLGSSHYDSILSL